MAARSLRHHQPQQQQERGVDVVNILEDLEDDDQLDLNALKEEIFLKLLVLGDLGVGKTTLIRNYTGEEGGGSASGGGGNSADYKVSVGAEYSLKRVDLEGKSVHIQLWDVPGHERFGGMTRALYKYAHGAIIVFDLARPETFEAALSWLSDVTEKLFDERQPRETNRIVTSATSTPTAASNGRSTSRSSAVTSPEAPTPTDGQQLESANSAMPIILLANKCDLPDLKVPRNKYSTYVKENGLLSWYETSARDPSCGVALAIRRLVEYVIETDPSLRIARENAMIWKS